MTKPDAVHRHLRCPTALYRAIEQLAREHHRSVNGEIVKAIEEYLGARTLPADDWCPACGAPVPTCACVALGDEQ